MQGATAVRAPASQLGDVCHQVPALSAEYARLDSLVPAAHRSLPVTPLADRERSAIVVDEWGPYDWRSPKLWPVDSTHARPLRLVVLGPPGKWRVRSRRGVESLSRQSGQVGDTITIRLGDATSTDWDLVLEYTGGATTSPRGERRAAGVPYTFGYSQFEPIQRWNVRVQKWSELTDPRTASAAFEELMRGEPLLSRMESRLDYMWYQPTVTGIPQARFAVEATTEVTLAPGEYTLRAVSDDAARVWIDGRLAIDNWTPHESAVDNARLAGGRHIIRVLHYQVEGWTELRVEIVRGVQSSRGSAGPH